MDVDTIYQGFDRVLPNVDYLVASSEFPTAWTGETDPFKALETIQKQFGIRVAAMILGAHGALARENGKFYYSPAFVVNCVDTTGVGDVFHGAFCYAVLQAMPMRQALDFSNAMAALNCTALGARGGIRGLDDVASLMGRAERRSHPDYVQRATRGSLSTTKTKCPPQMHLRRRTKTLGEYSSCTRPLQLSPVKGKSVVPGSRNVRGRLLRGVRAGGGLMRGWLLLG